MIGWALIDPGDRPRGEALADAAREAVRLIAGVVVMLAIAAAVEGFLSPQTTGLLQANEPRIVLGVVLWLAAMLWLLGAGRRARPEDASEAAAARADAQRSPRRLIER